MSDPALELDGIVKTFEQGGASLEVLRGASLSVEPGEIVALVGPSGAGKSTLLHIAGLLEQPSDGDVLLNGESCGGLSDDRRTELRRGIVGFVYQFHHLLPEFSALENVVLPQMVAGVARRQARVRAHELLGAVGLGERETHRPGRLSGGEQQRVAIARALANAPRLLIADEPTGNLDQHTAADVFAMLLEMVRQSGLAALIATHNSDLAARMDRVLALRDGAVVEG
jgi:lipoprotein-releasing system ATP-binding protein